MIQSFAFLLPNSAISLLYLWWGISSTLLYCIIRHNFFLFPTLHCLYCWNIIFLPSDNSPIIAFSARDYFCASRQQQVYFFTLETWMGGRRNNNSKSLKTQTILFCYLHNFFFENLPMMLTWLFVALNLYCTTVWPLSASNYVTLSLSVLAILSKRGLTMEYSFQISLKSFYFINAYQKYLVISKLC